MAKAKKPKPKKARRVARVEPALSPADVRALNVFVQRLNKKPSLFLGTRFVFRGSLIHIEEE
jgi:hypothetical protein